MGGTIPYGKQYISKEDIAAVVETLNSDYLTEGSKIEEFEKKFAVYIGCNYAVAVSNGTAALHLCAMALNVQPGDKVITTPITFAASSNCVRYCGGEIVYADIDRETYLMSIDNVRALLTASSKGTYKGIIPVDFTGRAVDLEALRRLADEYGLWIIEDACHAPGGFFIDSLGIEQFCGNGKFSELSIFSFHPVKHIATGEGGMITTNDKKLYERLMMLRTHGITRNNALFKNSIDLAGGAQDTGYPGWYMEMQELGYNYRLTDIQAALGISQLSRADDGISQRKRIARRYEAAFSGKSFIKKQIGFVTGHAYHLYIIEVEKRLELYNYLRSKSIFAQVHYIPTHLMPYYRGIGYTPGIVPAAEDYYASCISLPMYPTLTEEEQDYVIYTIQAFYS